MTTARMPAPAVEDLRAALLALGFDPCAEHAPADQDEEVSGLLACLLAVTQRHIQGRERHSDVIDVAYHETRRALAFPPCTCGSPHDISP